MRPLHRQAFPVIYCVLGTLGAVKLQTLVLPWVALFAYSDTCFHTGSKFLWELNNSNKAWHPTDDDIGSFNDYPGYWKDGRDGSLFRLKSQVPEPTWASLTEVTFNAASLNRKDLNGNFSEILIFMKGELRKFLAGVWHRKVAIIQKSWSQVRDLHTYTWWSY